MSYFNSLEYQINLHNDWEADMERMLEQRGEHIIECGDYVLLPGGDPGNTGWGSDMDDMQDTGDWINPEACDTCSHGMPTVLSASKPHAVYHLDDDRWVLCDDAFDHDLWANDPSIPNAYTYDGIAEAA